MEKHVLDHHTINGDCTTGQCIEGEPGYNKKGKLHPKSEIAKPKKIIATAQIKVTESGTMTMEANKTKPETNV